MEKNINGCPICRSAQKNAATSCLSTEQGGQMHDHSCGGDGSCLDEMPLAYVYAPNQKFRMMYSAQNALSHGTLFEELYKPMEVYGRE